MITIQAARALYAQSDSVHDFDHVMRVYTLSRHIALAERADLEIVETAALLHDIARTEADRAGIDHAAVAGERTRELLRGHAAERVEAVVHAIAAHRFRGAVAPATLEAQVLFDADKLDAIGAVGVARAFAYGGLHGQRLWADVPLPGLDPEAPANPALPAPEEHTPVHEFVYKLSRLRDRLYTRTGRAIADERHEFMLSFYARLREEVRGDR